MIQSIKKALRESIEEKKKQLDESDILVSDRQIARNLFELPLYERAKVIFSFVGRAGEIDTKPIILDALAMGKRVCVPRCVSKGVMHAYEITRLSDLAEGRYGILEPKDGCVYVSPSEIDFVIVPCVTCDARGYRLGYGGGFYDRYLENQSFIKAVLCRSALFSDEIPIEKHDVAVDIVVTDTRCSILSLRKTI